MVQSSDLQRKQSGGVSLRADSTDSMKRSDVPPPVESAHQRHKAGLKSCVVPRLEEPNLIVEKIFIVLL